MSKIGPTLRARCDADLKSRVLKFAERFRTDEAHIIRLAVEDYLERGNESASLPEPYKKKALPPKKASLDVTVAERIARETWRRNRLRRASVRPEQ